MSILNFRLFQCAKDIVHYLKVLSLEVGHDILPPTYKISGEYKAISNKTIKGATNEENSNIHPHSIFFCFLWTNEQ